jgi:hypothetical protein
VWLAVLATEGMVQEQKGGAVRAAQKLGLHARGADAVGALQAGDERTRMPAHHAHLCSTHTSHNDDAAQGRRVRGPLTVVVQLCAYSACMHRMIDRER